MLRTNGSNFQGSVTSNQIQHQRSGNINEHLAAQSLGNNYGGCMTTKPKTGLGMHTDPKSTYFSESNKSLKTQ